MLVSVSQKYVIIFLPVTSSDADVSSELLLVSLSDSAVT